MLRWRSIGVWWVCAVLLGGAALLLGRAGETVERGSASLGIDPAAVTGVTSERGGVVVRLERSVGTPWRWVVRSGGEAWAADESRVRAGLRLLGSATFERGFERGVEGGVGGDEEGTRLVIESASGRAVLAVGDDALGGVVAGTLGDGGEPVWVGRDLALAVRPTALLAWRDPSVLRGLGGGPGRVSLRVGPRLVVLERSASGWAIREPVRVEADASAVESLLGALRGVRASGFVDELGDGAGDELAGGDGDASGGALARVTLETAGPGDSTGAVQELTLFGGGDTGGVLGEAAWRFGEVELRASTRIDPQSLNAVIADPRAYVRRRALPAQASDVRAVSVGGWRVERDAGGWRVGERAADGGEVRGVTTLLEILTASASAVDLPEALPEGAVEVVVEGLSGSVLARCWVLGEGEGVSVVRTVASGSGEAFVGWRVASGQGEALAEWLASR